ncbi:MAG: 3-oxoacyl-[acyl-carrier-protein] reductase [Dehalococcoidia bacterium]
MTEGSGPLAGKAAIVTGGSRGIGRAIALELGRLGADVLLTYRSNAALASAVVDEVRARGVAAEATAVDVRNAADLERMVEEARARFGDVQILVNNAGMNDDRLVMRMGIESWDDVIATNLTSTFLATKLVLRHMTRARWGRIINISSVAGVMGNAGQANYAASKAGVLGFTRSVAREVASRGITVNAVAPGFTETDMTSGLTPEQKTTILTQVPMGRYALPEDIAPLVGFLATDGAAYITGQTFNVDGGLVMG